MVLFDVLIFLVVLGLLIFVHELGHFLAAKSCGVYCDRFSLGMPPRIWGIRWGETDYCIGALPIGGYVKMAGQEDSPLSDEQRQQEYGHVSPSRWYNNRPVWQRTIIIAAGPLMNLVLGVILYGVVAALGEYVAETKVDNRIGYIEPDGSAATAPLYLFKQPGVLPDTSASPDATGWQTGDRIVSIDDYRVTNISDVAMNAILGGGKTLNVVIERTTPDGAVARYLSPAEPKVLPDDPEKRPRFGVAPFNTALVSRVQPGLPAETSGLLKDDIIEALDGRPIDSETFSRFIETATDGRPLNLTVLRGGERVTISLVPKTVGRIKGIHFSPYLEDEVAKNSGAPLRVAFVDRKQANADCPLKSKDIIKKVNGEPATPALLQQFERDHPGGTVQLEVLRPKLLFGLVRKESTFAATIPIASASAIGVEWGEKMVFHRVPAAEVVPEAFRRGYGALDATVRTLSRLIGGHLSPKDLGGPVLIYQITTQAARLGYSWLLEITAFISINLCVFNLLPLPVLDGGQLVFLLIEKVSRRPVSLRIQERVQQVGLVLIVSLILFVTYNDIMRLVRNWLPE